MIDKEIIIDGVNVAGCKFRCYIDRCMAHSCTTKYCKEYSNCYYKQLQCKEQECEELRKYKDVVNKLAGLQIILTNKDKMPELYENAKDLKIDRYKQALEKIEEECEHYTNAPLNFEAIYAKSSMDEIIDILNEVKDA